MRQQRGAPAEYARNGQSQRQRNSISHTALTPEANNLRIIREDSGKLRAKMPRLTWQQVVERGGEFKYSFADADQTPRHIGNMRLIPPALLHQAALALYDCGAPIESVRAAVELAWVTHSSLFMSLAGDAGYPILRHCNFTMPAEFGSVFPVWRGTRGVGIEAARAGHSWTTDPRIACTWAVHIGARDNGTITGQLLVLRRDVRADHVILYSDEHGMKEVVIDAEPDGRVDGEIADWMTIAREYAHLMARLDALERGALG